MITTEQYWTKWELSCWLNKISALSDKTEEYFDY